LIFLIQEENVLLLKGAPKKRLWANLYNGIGGHIEKGEDPLTAALRELHEETGITGVDLRLCGTIMVDTGEDLGIGIFVFKGSWAGGTLQPSSEGSLKWLPVDQLDQFPLVEDLYTLLPAVISLDKTDPPISALYSYDKSGRLVIRFGR
jgi:8-oxo-dGTP diphosphatase